MNSPPDITFGPEGHHVTIVAEMHGGPFHVFPKTTHFTDGDSRTAMSMRLLLSGAVDGLAEEIGINKNIASNFGLEWTSSWLNETTYHLEVTGLSYFEAYWEVQYHLEILILTYVFLEIVLLYCCSCFSLFSMFTMGLHQVLGNVLL